MGMGDAPTKTPDAATATTPAPPVDVVVLGPPTADGGGVHVLRARDEKIETGELRALQEGRPITGEVVTLEPRKENPRVCDVRSTFSPPSSVKGSAAAAPHKGPARVATQAYRDGWDEIFGQKPN